LKVLPLRVLGIYRFDYAALHWGVPLVPYAKLGLVYDLWWATKGDGVEFVNGERAAGGKWGYSFTGGLSLLLDVLEPRLARDFDVDLGVNHSYLFAEYTYENVDDFGSGGLDLSSRHWMFGLALEY
ncbi:MAG: MXAN_2562 family outer membrane beta-barrel protein, partial [Myxococcaceae bacterium]